MLNKEDLKDYRIRSGLSLRDVSSYCDISYQLVGMIEQGVKDLTAYNYNEVVKGINAAKFAKANGTFKQSEKFSKIENTSDKDISTKTNKSTYKHKNTGGSKG